MLLQRRLQDTVASLLYMYTSPWRAPTTNACLVPRLTLTFPRPYASVAHLHTR